MSKDFRSPILPNVTRWASHFSMLKRFCKIANIFMLDADFNVNKNDLLFAREIVTILQPMCDVLKIVQTTNRPTGFATLPLIKFLCLNYGICVAEGIFDGELNGSWDVDEISLKNNVIFKKDYVVVKIQKMMMLILGLITLLLLVV